MQPQGLNVFLLKIKTSFFYLFIKMLFFRHKLHEMGLRQQNQAKNLNEKLNFNTAQQSRCYSIYFSKCRKQYNRISNMSEKEQIKVYHYKTTSSCEYTLLPYINSRPSSKKSRLSTPNISIKPKSFSKSPLEQTSIQIFLEKYQLSFPDCPSILSLIKTGTPNQAKNITLSQLQKSQFPVLEYSLRDLIQFSVLILKTSQFCRLNFPSKVLRKIVTVLAESYRDVPYHNYSHAFSLMLFNYQCLVKQFSLKYLYTQQEYFCILIAGLAHDINHPGTNNSFEVKINSKLAIIADNQSVLEKMHLSFLWKILENHTEYNFLQHTQNPSKAKQIITRLILSTDMAVHSKNLQKFHLLKRKKQFDPKHHPEHKWLLMEQIFHGCDIGNSCSEYQNYINWAALLCSEFNQIAKLQEANGVEVTRFLTFKESSQLYEDQICFVGSMVLPLWKQIIEVCPDLAFLQKKILGNIKKVKEELKKIKKAKQANVL